MRFELVSENKIKIEISKEDLIEYDMKIVELAYGSDKAKEFFHEVMEKAYEELGFNVNNIPILVEAIPVSLEEICIYVTKVTDPNELENRISNMPNENIIEKKSVDFDVLRKKLELAKENIINEISSNVSNKKDVEIKEFEPTVLKRVKPMASIIIFSFKTIDDATFASKRIPEDLLCKSSLILNDEKFYLTLESVKNSQNEFENVETFLYEYGEKHISTIESKHYLVEHGELIIKKDAIQILSNLN